MQECQYKIKINQMANSLIYFDFTYFYYDKNQTILERSNSNVSGVMARDFTRDR